jgi:hypothetical protein
MQGDTVAIGRVHRMSTDLSMLASRRALLTAAAGGAAALAVSSLARPFPAAAAASNMQTETDNPTSAPTGVSNATADSDALFGDAMATGTGVTGKSVTGIGVSGVSSDTSDPLGNDRNTGVFGVAGDPADVDWSTGLTGVFGYSPASTDLNTFATGVWGDSGDVGVYGTGGGVGVRGDGGTYGVLGQTWGPNTVGVLARANPISIADTGTVPERALRVEGRAEFTRSGRARISAGHAKKTVSLAGCTANTLVIAVINSNRSGRFVRAAVPTTGSFTIYLNTSVSAATYVAWIAFTNPSNHLG